jgi:hypothetical protein
MLMRFALLTIVAALAMAIAPIASGDSSDTTKLAERYAPVLRLVAYTGGCGEGEPYVPIDVNVLFDEPTVALRGPWGGGDLVKIGPAATDLSHRLYDYHLDFPGTALAPGCTYLDWQRRLYGQRRPVVYAHVATDPAFPKQLALQYWLFYVFNDWNNLHEGDWEMIQLVFDAANPAQALREQPTEVGYSQHEGAERAKWGDSKLELVDGTHPVVHPAAGSHANFYGEALYLGASGSEGVGCDDTSGPTFDVRPVVQTIPSAPGVAATDVPWIEFQGRWGELRPAFFNGPTGPNMKEQWTEPILWSKDWRSRSLTVPGASAFGPAATGFFCDAIAAGSRGLVRLVDRPLEVGLVLVGLALLVLFGLSRATWRPASPLRIARRRAWGQILSASSSMYADRTALFVAIGVALLPISLVVTLLQALVIHATSIVGVQTTGDNKGVLAVFVLAIGTALTLFGLGLVQAATARALVEIDEGRPIGPLRAYRLASETVRPLLSALVIASVVVSLLAATGFGLPIAIWLAGRWALIVPVIELEDASVLGSLRRSGRLVRGRWLKASSLIVASGLLVLLIGPLIGVLLIVGTDAPFWLVNVVAGIVYSVAMPFVALTTAYAYFDARVRAELTETRQLGPLPAEIELSV